MSGISALLGFTVWTLALVLGVVFGIALHTIYGAGNPVLNVQEQGKGIGNFFKRLWHSFLMWWES